MSVYNGKLFHGTNMKLIEMNQRERTERLQLCKDIADYAYRFLMDREITLSPKTHQQLSDKSTLGDIWINLWNRGISKYQGFLNGSSLYQYNCLYVTNSYERAANYAKNSSIYGEQGDVALWLYLGAQRFNNFKARATKQELEKLESFQVITRDTHKPIVITLKGIEKEVLS